MPITEKQRQARKDYIGSSDAAAILGCDQYRNAADVYYSKTEDLAESTLSEAALLGNVLEEAILDWFSNERNIRIVKNQFRVHDNGFMAANIDAIAPDEPAIVEAKTTGIITPFDRNQWGEVGTDQIPEKYIIQCQHQMAVLGAEYRVAWVPVLLGGVGLRIYRVDRDDELIDCIENCETKFWQSNIEPKEPPTDLTPSIEVLKRIHRIPAKTVSMESQLVSEWINAKALLKSFQQKKDEAEQVLLAALGDAEAAECELGKITYLEQRRASYQVKESSFRTLRFKSSGGKNELI